MTSSSCFLVYAYTNSFFLSVKESNSACSLYHAADNGLVLMLELSGFAFAATIGIGLYILGIFQGQPCTVLTCVHSIMYSMFL